MFQNRWIQSNYYRMCILFIKCNFKKRMSLPKVFYSCLANYETNFLTPTSCLSTFWKNRANIQSRQTKRDFCSWIMGKMKHNYGFSYFTGNFDWIYDRILSQFVLFNWKKTVVDVVWSYYDFWYYWSKTCPQLWWGWAPAAILGFQTGCGMGAAPLSSFGLIYVDPFLC